MLLSKHFCKRGLSDFIILGLAAIWLNHTAMLSSDDVTGVLWVYRCSQAGGCESAFSESGHRETDFRFLKHSP